MLKNQSQESLQIIDLRFELQNVKDSIKAESKRISELEEGAEVDLSHLQVDGAGLKELFRIMQELKTEIMQKTASRAHLSEIEKKMEEINDDTKDRKQAEREEAMLEELRDGLSKMSAIPPQLQQLQL